MKIIASTGDNHFYFQGARWAECNRIHNWMADDMRRRGVSLLTINGDFCEKESTPVERHAIKNWLRNVAQSIDVVGVRGNHDQVLDLDCYNDLDTAHKIYIEEQVSVRIVNGCALALMAWPRKAVFLAGLPADVSPEEAEEILRERLKIVLLDLRDQLAKHDGPRILSIHCQVSGAKVSTGQPIVGGDMELSQEEIALVGADIVLMSHVHMAQEFEFNGVPMVYCGSPYATAWGETETKSYVVAEFNDTRVDGKILNRWYRVETPRAAMLLIDEAWGRPEEGADPTWMLGAIGLDHPEDSFAGTEVRFRFTVDSDQQKAAKHAAKEVEAYLLKCGAVSVKLEMITNATVRARVPEIANAFTLKDKLEVLWKSQGFIPDARRRESIFAKLSIVEAEIGTIISNRSHSVQFNSLRLSGISPFTQDVSIDFDTLPGPLTAITGRNGEGKSTLLGALAAAIYRNMPGRNKLSDIFTEKNSSIEVGLTNGNRWNIRQSIDGIASKPKQSTLITDALGNAVNVSAKVTEGDQWIATHLPASEVFFASTFAAQDSTGFVGLSPSKRKGLVLRSLGIEIIEAQSKSARDKAAAVKVQLTRLEERLRVTRAQGGDVTECEAALAEAQHQEWEAEADLSEAREALLAAQVEARDAGEDLTKLKNWHERNADLNNRLVIAERNRIELERKIAGNKSLIDQSEGIEAAVLKAAELDTDKERLAADLATASVSVSAFRSEINSLETEIRAYESREARLHDDIANATSKLLEKDAVDGAVEALPALKAELARLDAAYVALSGELAEFDAQQLTGAEGRIVDLRTGLLLIRFGEGDGTVADSKTVATITLDADDGVVKAIESRPALRKELFGKVVDADKARQTAASTVRYTEANAAKAPMLAMVYEQRLKAATELGTVLTLNEAAQAKLIPLREDCARLVSVESSLRTQVAENKTALDALRTPLALLESLRAAQTLLAEQEPRLSTILADITGLDSEIAENGPEPKQVTAVDIPSFEAKVSEADALLKTQQRLTASKEQALGLAKGIAEQVEQINTELQSTHLEYSDWIRLADDLGRDGIQAIEIDAVFPELTAKTNHLLRDCANTKYTVSFETTRTNNDGDVLEGCFVKVINNELGKEYYAEDLSGGEGALVGEAISLALTETACRRSNVTGPTLIRDETKFLDAANSRLYIEMLRDAIKTIGASRCLYVSHNQEQQELADSRIHIENGMVSIAA